MIKIIFTCLISIFISLNTFAKSVTTEEVFNISETTTLTFNKRLNTFSIFLSNSDKSIELFYGDKLKTIKFINNLIFDTTTGKSEYYSTIDDDKNFCIFIPNNNDIFYILDIDLYKIKHEIIKKRIN